MNSVYPCLYRGIVLDNKDPLELGRCKVNIPSLYGSLDITPTMLPWSRLMNFNPCSKNRTSYNLPDIGDVVWVFFEGGDKDSPVYFGGSIGKDEIPVDANTVIFYIEEDNYIKYDREMKEYTINIGKSSIKMSTSGIDLHSELSISLKGTINIEGQLSVNGKIIN